MAGLRPLGLWGASLLLLCGVARAERARSPQGVELPVPAGYAWERDKRPKPTTVLCLEATGPAPRAQILVNHIKLGSSTQAEVYQLFLESLEGMSPKHDEVELPSGKYLRVDFVLDDPPRKLKQRWYVALRDQRVFQFVLSNVDEGRFEELVSSFDAAIASARFFPPEEPKPPEKPPERPLERPPVAEKAPPPVKPPEKPPVTEQAPPPEKPPGKPPVAEKPPEKPPVAGKPPEKAPVAGKPPVAGESPGADAAFAREAQLVSATSEYDPDFWAAKHLFDQRADRGWCSRPGSAFPHQLVFVARAPVAIAAVSFDDDCPVEPGFEGAAARDFTLELSSAGPGEGWEQVLAGKLEAGQNGQRFPLPPGARGRWLRLSIFSNHGNPKLTELMELRVFPAADGPPAAAVQGSPPAPAPGASGEHGFLLDKLRASRQRNGDAAGGSDAFRAGERVWINFKPRGLSSGADGKYWLEVDLVLEDEQGRAILRRDKVVEQRAPLPAPPLSNFVALHLDLPEGFPGGSYVVRVVARDGLVQTSAAGTCRFQVRD